MRLVAKPRVRTPWYDLSSQPSLVQHGGRRPRVLQQQARFQRARAEAPPSPQDMKPSQVYLIGEGYRERLQRLPNAHLRGSFQAGSPVAGYAIQRRPPLQE